MNTHIERIRNEMMTLSVSERACLAHDLILSLDESDNFELSPEQESEISRRMQSIIEGTASGRPAEDVFADIRARLK